MQISKSLGGATFLGKHVVARVGYGAMQLRNCAKDPAQAIAVLRRAWALGIDHVDTAHFYGNGFVNDVIRQAIDPEQPIVIASKVGADPDPTGKAPIKLAQRPEQLRASVEANLVSLGLDHIPLVNLRRADGAHGMEIPADQRVDLDDQLAMMVKLRYEGKIGAVGLSAVSLSELERALPAGIACVQNAYSLVNRDCEDMLTLCREHRVAWVPFFPLGGAAPGLPKVTEHPVVQKIAARLNLTESQVGLAWLLQHAPNMLLIPGTANISHLEENVAAGSIILDATAVDELNAAQAEPHTH